MKLYDNDAYREDFMELVYDLLDSDETNDRANQIIEAFDMAPAVEADPLPPNAPLTLDELREIEGKPVPVWCDKANGYIFIATTKTEPYNQVWYFNYKGFADTVLYYSTKFYRRKPEEGTK